jgi:hypothetical protein
MEFTKIIVVVLFKYIYPFHIKLKKNYFSTRHFISTKKTIIACI